MKNNKYFVEFTCCRYPYGKYEEAHLIEVEEYIDVHEKSRRWPKCPRCDKWEPYPDTLIFIRECFWCGEFKIHKVDESSITNDNSSWVPYCYNCGAKEGNSKLKKK